MSRQDANAAFARTSFLYGGNADYLENLYARYETDPTSIDAQWQEFFQSLKDERADVMTNARGRHGSGPTSSRAASSPPRSTAIGARWRGPSATRSRHGRRRPASTSRPPRSSRRRAIRSAR